MNNLKPNSKLTLVLIESALLNKPIEKNLLSKGDFNPFLLFPLVSSQYNFEKQLKNIALIIIKDLYILFYYPFIYSMLLFSFAISLFFLISVSSLAIVFI